VAEEKLLPPRRGGRPAAIWRLPKSILDRVAELRVAGWSASQIWDELQGEFEARDVNYDALANYLQGRIKARDDRRHPETAAPYLGRLAALLHQAGVDPADIGRAEKIRVSTWQSITKDAEGEAHVHDLSGANIVLAPSWAEGPKWQPIDRGPPMTPRVREPRKVKGKWRRCFLWPDTQVGYRRDLTTMELEPFQDEQAIAVALAALRDYDPDLVIIIGDFQDFAEFGKFDQEAGFALTVQPGVDRGTLLIAEIRAAAPHAEIVFIPGNHDERLHKMILRNARAAYGIRRGTPPGATPDTWPQLSVPSLLRLDEQDVKYVGAYPASVYWINENVCAIHGARITSAGSTALKQIDDSRVSVVFGHVHRLELIHRTRLAYSGAKRNFAASIGCLCRLDGAVPSTHSADLFGRAVPTVENWQHGFGLLAYEPGDGRFHLDIQDIQDGMTYLWGQEIRAGKRT
jgi:hypothetical protein